MKNIWKELYEAAISVNNPRQVSPLVEAGGVSAAVESETGNIYTGVCVDTACTLGICAERNAIFHMLAQGENRVRRVVAVSSDKKTVPPCGACRELMAQLCAGQAWETEILLDYETGRVVKLKDLTPEWWI